MAQLSGHDLPTLSQVSMNSESVPFRLVDGYAIVLQGRIGSRDCNMLLDTGANPTIIDSRIAEELGSSGSDVIMTMINGPVHFQKTELPTIQVGPLRREKLMVLVRDLTFIRDHLKIPIDAVLGMDVLSAVNFTIDYKHKRLIFSAPQDDDDELEFIDGPPFMVVNANIGDSQLRLLVDTGTSSIVLFDSMVHHKLHETTLRIKEGVNLGGHFSAKGLLLRNVRLSKTRLVMHPAFLTNDQQGWGQTFDGLLGPAAVGLTRVTFDFQARKLRWKH